MHRPGMRTIRTFAAVAATVAALVATTASDSDSDSAEDKKAGIGQGDAKGSDKEKSSDPKMTTSQENAVKSAESYLTMGSGFSRQGLIGQLTSKMGEGFPPKDAVFAVDYLNVNWNKQAVISAKNYLDMSGFSCSGLVQQLSSSAGDQFTKEQATYAGEKVGLC